MLAARRRAGLGLAAGALALTYVLVGPQGLGPGAVFVQRGPVVAVLVLIGRRGARSAPTRSTRSPSS